MRAGIRQIVGLVAGLMLAFSCAAGVGAAASAAAAPLVKLHAAFIPYHLNASSTIKFGFQVSTTDGSTPPPLVGVDLHLPAEVNQNASQLGLAICNPADLLELGPAGCPVNSKVGFGSARVEAPFGDEQVKETTRVTAFSGPANSPSELLFFNQGQSPIASRLVYRGKTLEEKGEFSGDLRTLVPLIPTVPDGDYMATTSFESTLGPLGLTYQREIHGHLEDFHPSGIFIPKRCPAGGFPFMVDVRFGDGSEATDRTAVPCPHPGHGGGR